MPGSTATGIWESRRLAALIQDDIGANPEDPHAGAHGTFSFDIANGACGVLTALQIVDGFLRTHSIQRALVVASDADPGHGMSEHFPFSAAGAALLCGWTDDSYGLSRVSWVNVNDAPDDAETFSATVGFADARNVLRFNQSAAMDEQFAAAAAEAARACLDAQSVRLSDIDMIVAAPARPGYRAALSNRLGVDSGQISIADDQRTCIPRRWRRRWSGRPTGLPAGAQILLVAAGAGVTAGAALYRQPPLTHAV